MIKAIALALLIGMAAVTAAYADALDDARAGNEAFAAHDLEGAIEAFSRAITSGELSGEALSITYNNRGVVYGELGDFDRALEDYEKALEIRPGDDTTLRNLRVALTRRGSAYANLGEAAKAMADYDRAIKLDPTAPLPQLRRGQLLAELGEFDKAIADLARADQLEPNNREIRETLDRVRADAAAARRPGGPLGAQTTARPSPAEGPAADAGSAAPSIPAAPPASTAARSQEPSPSQAQEPPAQAQEPPAVTEEGPPDAEAGLPEPAAGPQADETARQQPRQPAAPQTEEQSPEPQVAPAPPPSQTAAGRGEPYRTVTAVNYRAGPANDARRLGTLREGQVIEVLGEELGWKHFRLEDGSEGYVYKRWVEPVGN
jgi:tetratricopeptide (TPR) repeat protein